MKLKQQTRLSILVIVLAAVLLEANTALEFFSTRRSFNEQLTEKAQRDLNESHRIGKVKQEVETAVRAALPTIERLAMEVDADSLRQAMRQLVLGQEQIVGVSVGFQPGYVHGGVGAKHTDGALFGLYVYEVGEGKDMRLKEPTYDIDYTQRPWYERALGSDGYWSEPYEGKYSYVLMCSYSLPVHDAHGQTVAVLSADVPLRELSQMAAQFYENQQRAVLRNTLLHLLGLLLLGFIVYRAVAYLRRLQTVSAEKERIAGELRVAHDIQQSMIPKTFPGFPERDDLELYAQLTPAREVGGDFYDFLIRDERLYFCVGDVTGKGVPAALLMTVMRALFRVLSEESRVKSEEFAAAAIVQQLNTAMCEEQTDGYFATMFVGVLNLTTGMLDYCNAGHERPILLRVKGKVNSEKFATALDSKRNLPVGAMPGWQFEGQQVQLTAGEMLFLYTDGLNEARDAHDRPLSRDRVLSLARQHSDETPRHLVELMEAAAHNHAAGIEQSDDITLMALRWLGCNRLELQTDGSDLALLEGFVEQVGRRARLAEQEVPRLRVAVEEAVTNVIGYAHATSIVLTSEVRDAVLRLTVTDDGQPFDPTTAPMADTSIPADQREEGGLGILFIRRMSDALEYRREDGRNILTIKKRCKM
ncbi:MAG: SpoIIE family protein phosphatase [Prevotella sp.]|nr:SpoIIE family protein phosphatase [Prevotella sp.]